MMSLFSWSAVLGANTAHYVQDSVVEASARVQAGEVVVQQAFQLAKQRVSRADRAIADGVDAIALSSGRIVPLVAAPSHLVLQSRSELLATEFDRLDAALGGNLRDRSASLRSAIARAVERLRVDGGYDALRECSAEAVCVGPDLSHELADLLDQDPAFQPPSPSVEAVVVTMFDAPASALPLGLGAREPGQWIMPAVLAISVPSVQRALDRVHDLASDARHELHKRASSPPADPAQLRDWEDRIDFAADTILEFTDRSSREIGELLFQSVQRNAPTVDWPAFEDLGVCVNPTDWGGCVGEDLTGDLVEGLRNDEELDSLLRTLLDSLRSPDISGGLRSRGEEPAPAIEPRRGRPVGSTAHPEQVP